MLSWGRMKDTLKNKMFFPEDSKYLGRVFKVKAVKEFIKNLKEDINEIMEECGGSGGDLESPEVENYMPAAIIKRLDERSGGL